MPVRTIRGQSVVITGATSGIGRETALAFARAGARVVVAGRRQERLDELVAEVEGRRGEALAVQTDVAEQTQVERLIERAVERFGAVDTLVNNAGVGIAAPFEQQSIEDFRRVMEVNFWGAVYGCKAVVPLLRQRPYGGVIINVSSIAANAMTEGRSGHYGVTKVAVEAMTRGFAVLALKPRGGVDTPGYRFARGGVIAEGIPGPEDFAEAAVILATATPTTLTGDALFDDDVIARWGRGGTI